MDGSKLNDASGKSFILTHNLKGKQIESWHKQLSYNEQFRKVKRKDSVYYTHEILSWHKDDAKNMSLDKMEEMTKEYIKNRNPRGQYIAVPHFDKEHPHVHIMASGIEYRSGKALRLSRAAFSDLKKGMQNYQISKYPELSKSVVSHGKKVIGKISDNEFQLKLRSRRDTYKEKFISQLKTSYQKATSPEHLKQLLSKFEMKTYERGGKIKGVIYANQKFRFNRLGFTELIFTTQEISRKINRTDIEINYKKRDLEL